MEIIVPPILRSHRLEPFIGGSKSSTQSSAQGRPNAPQHQHPCGSFTGSFQMLLANPYDHQTMVQALTLSVRAAYQICGRMGHLAIDYFHRIEFAY